VSGPPAPPPATPGQAEHVAREMHAAYWRVVAAGHWAWETEEQELREGWLAAAQVTLADLAQARRELAEAREKLAATQAIARMLRATAIEILAAYESGTVVSDELAGIWRERLGGDHA